MRCALYIRVSTDMQRERGESLEVQQKRLKAYVESKEDWSVAGIYRDAGVSAKDTNRPEFNRMMTDVKENKADVILCTKLDRLFRNTKDFLDTTELLDELDIGLVILEGNIDTTTASGELYSTMRAAFAQFERRTTAERVRVVMLSRAEDGKWNGGVVPYGYKAKNKKLKLDPVESEIVKRIYEYYIEDKSLRRVTHRLNRDGIRTRKGDLWAPISVRRILTNPFYYGVLVYNKRSNARNGKLKRNPKEKYVLGEGKFPRIVSRELHDTVGAIIKHRAKCSPRTDAKYLLTGIIYCGFCGSRMSGAKTGRKNKRYLYYRCSGYLHKGSVKCIGNMIRSDLADELITEKLKNLTINQERLKGAFEEFSSQEDDMKTKKDKLCNYNRELERNRSRRQKIFELYEDGSINKADFLIRKKAIDERETHVSQEIDKLKSTLERTDIDSYNLDYLSSLCKDMKEVFDELELEDKQELLRNLLEEVKVNKHNIDYSVQVFPKDLIRTNGGDVCANLDDTGNRNQSFRKPSLKISFRTSLYPNFTIGQKIRKARLERDLFQVDLAKKLGVDEMTIVNWELDRTRPRRGKRRILNKFLGIEV